MQYFHHFRPQVEFISPKTHIWKYEDGMGKEFVSWLSELLGFDFVFKDNAELEYKINQSVKNQEEQPINIKDVNATSGYVDMRRKQLEIDKQFNTADGVVY